MMEFFLSGSLPLIDFVICDVMSDMANKLLSLSLSLSLSMNQVLVTCQFYATLHAVLLD